MDFVKTSPTYFNSLSQVKSYCKSTGTAFSHSTNWKAIISSWNTFGLPNRLKVFLIKYYNNTLGTGNRVVHIDPSKDPSCTFCTANNILPPPIESFAHIFYDCPVVGKILQNFLSKFIEPEVSRVGYFQNDYVADIKHNVTITLIMNCFRYVIWEKKLTKSSLSYYTVEQEIINVIELISGSNKKIKTGILNNNFIYLSGDGRIRGRRDDGHP